MKAKFSKSLALGLVALLATTACSKKEQTFSGRLSSKVINSKDDAARAEKAAAELNISDEEYKVAAEKYLDTDFEDAMSEMVERIEKAFGSEPVTLDGIEYDDPSAMTEQLLDRMEAASGVFDPYASPRELIEDMGVDVDFTDREAVKAFIAESEDDITLMKETLAEVGPYYSMGPIGQEESSEELSLVQQAQTAYVCRVGDVCASTINDAGKVTVSTSVPGTTTTTTTTNKAVTTKNKAVAQPTVTQAVTVAPTPVANKALTDGFPAAYANLNYANSLYGAQYTKMSGASAEVKAKDNFLENSVSATNAMGDTLNNQMLGMATAFNALYGL